MVISLWQWQKTRYKISPLLCYDGPSPNTTSFFESLCRIVKTKQTKKKSQLQSNKKRSSCYLTVIILLLNYLVYSSLPQLRYPQLPYFHSYANLNWVQKTIIFFFFPPVTLFSSFSPQLHYPLCFRGKNTATGGKMLK